jgi:hypothetical protein
MLAKQKKGQTLRYNACPKVQILLADKYRKRPASIC